MKSPSSLAPHRALGFFIFSCQCLLIAFAAPSSTALASEPSSIATPDSSASVAVLGPDSTLRRKSHPRIDNRRPSSRQKPVVARAIHSLNVSASEYIQRGLSGAQVEKLLGPAPAQPTQDVWIYWDYCVADPTIDNQAFDTLLVIFEEGLVVDLRLVNGASVQGALALSKLRKR